MYFDVIEGGEKFIIYEFLLVKLISCCNDWKL